MGLLALILGLLLIGTAAALGVVVYRNKTRQPEPVGTWPVKQVQQDNSVLYAGVLHAVTGLPGVIRNLLQANPADLVTGGTVVDDHTMVFQVDGNIILTIRPFDRRMTLTAPQLTDNYCSISYAGGFKPEDIERLVGFHQLASRGSVNQTPAHWTSILAGSLTGDRTN